MTTIEAIKELRDASDNEVRYGDTEHHYNEVMKRIEAFDMAIKALEQQPCEDCISRKEMLKYQEYLHGKMSNEENHKLWEFIKQLPSVQPTRPTGHWIETAQEYYEMINEKGGGVDDNTPYFTDDIACSECLAKFSVIDNETERFDFCPNCGARMVEPQESEV